MSLGGKLAILATAAMLAAAVLISALERSLWTPDEPREAAMAREMLDGGDWARPKLNGGDFFEKPPLYYWASAASVGLFGARDFAPRIPALLFGALGIAFTALAAARAGGARAALVAAAALGGSALWLYIWQWALVDSAVGCAGAGALACLVWARESESPRARTLWCCGFWLACSALFLAKSVPALVAPGAALLALAAVERDWRGLLRMRPILGAGIFALVAGPWMLAAGPDWLAEHFRMHVLHRSVSGAGTGHARSFLYYAGVLPAFFLPWTLMLVPAVARLRSAWSGAATGRAARTLACWAAGAFVAYSIPATKREIYMAPVVPALAALVGLYGGEILSGAAPGMLGRIFLWALAALTAAAGLGGALYGVTGAQSAGAACAAWALLAAAVVCSAAALDGALGWKPGRALVGSSAAFAVGLLAAVLFIVPEVDLQKSFRPFMAEIARAASSPGEGEVAILACGADETLTGALYYYTGRRLTEVASREELARRMASGGRVIVLGVSKARPGSRPGASRELLRLPGARWRAFAVMGGGRALAAAANFAPGAPARRGEGAAENSLTSPCVGNKLAALKCIFGGDGAPCRRGRETVSRPWGQERHNFGKAPAGARAPAGEPQARGIEANG